MSSIAVDRVKDKLAGVKAIGAGWVAKCPAHEDQHQSLKIDEGDDGRVLVHCHAGCPPGAVIAALGLSLADMFPPKDKSSAKKGKAQEVLVATYDYRDAVGDLRYQACRYVPKTFRQRRPDPDVAGGWLWNLTGVARIPYKLAELQGHPVVVIVEGEKDVESLWALGIPATCNAGGAGKWTKAETAALKAAGCQRVIVIPDNDDAGQKHAETVAHLCRDAGMAITVTGLPGVGPKGDVSDWLAAGHTAEELKALFTKPYIVPAGGAAVEGPAPVAVDVTAVAVPTEPLFAERFAVKYGPAFRFDVRRRMWWHYETPAWRPDLGKTVRRTAVKFIRQQQAEALKITDYQQRIKWSKFALAQESKTGIDRLVALAEFQPEMMDAGNTWDPDPWLLGVPNGVVDLRTGKLRDGTPEDRITMVSGVPFDPELDIDLAVPRWNQFLEEVFSGDVSLIAFVHRLMGYMLTGLTGEQVLTMCYGPGSNGKSVFLAVLKHILGDYATTLPFSSLMHTSHEGASNDLASIQGKRMVAASEINEGVRLNEARLKALTGGDAISTRFLYSEYFTFTPVAKFVLSVNHKPVVRDDSYGFWRRVRLVPFLRRFDTTNRDPQLLAKLMAEAPGILRWAVDGCLAWQVDGLPLPKAIEEATADYEQDSDQISEFLKSVCLVEPDESCMAKELYRAYAEWADLQKFAHSDRLTANAFGRLIGSKFKKKHTMSGAVYLGLSVVRGKLSQSW